MGAFRGQDRGGPEGSPRGNHPRGGSGGVAERSPGSTGCAAGIDAYSYEDGAVDPATLHLAVREYYVQVQNMLRQTSQRRNAHSSGSAPAAQGDSQNADEHGAAD